MNDLVSAMNDLRVSLTTNSDSMMDELRAQMAVVKDLEAKLAQIEREVEISSYLIQEEPDLDELW